MTDNPSGSTGQNVTTTPNAPEAGSNGEREALICEVALWLTRCAHDARFDSEQATAEKHEEYAAKLKSLAAGFTRAHHVETVLTDRLVELAKERQSAIRERDEAIAQVAAVTNAYDLDASPGYKIALLDALKSLRSTQQTCDKVRAERDEARAHHDAIRGASLADAERLIAAVEKAGVQYTGCDTPDALADCVLALRAERVALAAKLAEERNEWAQISTAQRHRAEAAEARAIEAENANTANGLARCASDKRAAALAEALRWYASEGEPNEYVICKRAADGRLAAIAPMAYFADRARAALAGNGNGTGEGDDSDSQYACAVEVRDAVKHVGWITGGPYESRERGEKMRAELIGRGHNVGPLCPIVVPLPAAPSSAGETHDA